MVTESVLPLSQAYGLPAPLLGEPIVRGVYIKNYLKDRGIHAAFDSVCIYKEGT